MTAATREERVVGCFLASAVGDALGAEIEFLSLADIRQRHGPDGLTDYADDLGSITDDTQMLLFTAEALIRFANRGAGKGAVHADEVVHRAYLRWLRTQRGSAEATDEDGWLLTRAELHRRRAPGMTCLGSLETGRRGTIDAPINGSKGCGGVMRVAPIGLVAGADAFAMAAEAAAITHGHPSGYLSAGALARIIDRVLAGDDVGTAALVALDELAAWDGHQETTAAVRAALELADRRPLATPEDVERLGGGWVGEEALAISLYSALVATDLRHGLLVAVNHSGDSDSTGAICGAILGTRDGIGAVPTGWIDRLREHEVVTTVAEDLSRHFPASGMVPAHDVERYPPS
jgi:ADP-ribosyl-[dinitrogen reductase] hydrolase